MNEVTASHATLIALAKVGIDEIVAHHDQIAALAYVLVEKTGELDETSPAHELAKLLARLMEDCGGYYILQEELAKLAADFRREPNPSPTLA